MTAVYGRRCAPPGDAGPAARRRPASLPDLDRAQARAAAAARAGLAPYTLDLATVRGRCLARRCAGRWGVVRITVDLRGREADRFAAVECAACGRVWRRVATPPVRTRRGFQSVLLTAILPASAHRWYARGRWHREGDDGEVLRECDLGDLDEAVRAYRGRQSAVLMRLQRAKDRRASLEAAALADSRALMARLADIDAQRAADEAAAAAREAA